MLNVLHVFSCVCEHAQSLSRDLLFAAPGTIAGQAPLSMGFSRQEYCNGLPCPPPGNLPGPGIKPTFLISSALAGGFFTISTTCKIELMNKLKNIVINSSAIFIVATTFIEKKSGS